MDLPYHPTSRSSHRYVSKSCSGPGWQSRMKGTDFVVAVFVVYIISLQGFVLFCFVLKIYISQKAAFFQNYKVLWLCLGARPGGSGNGLPGL